MICVVDASVAVKWFVAGDWALQEDHVDNALALLQATAQGSIQLLQPPHFLAEVAAVLARLKPRSATWPHLTLSGPSRRRPFVKRPSWPCT